MRLVKPIAVANILKKSGWVIKHVSKSGSVYMERVGKDHSFDGVPYNDELRIADHALPVEYRFCISDFDLRTPLDTKKNKLFLQLKEKAGNG